MSLQITPSGTTDPSLLLTGSGAISLTAGGTNQNITLAPSGTGILEQRNGTNAQGQRWYATYTDVSNYERLALSFNGASYRLGVDNAGSGSNSRNLVLGSGDTGSIYFSNGGSDRWRINSSGNILALTDNTLDIGASGATRPRTGYFGTSVITPNLTLSGDQSAAAWTTNGLRLVGVAGTLTDTTSSGTVTAAYTNKLGGNTIAASSATTFTNYISGYFTDPVAGTNVTMTNKYAIGGDSMSIGTSTPISITNAGFMRFGGTTSSFPALKRSGIILQSRLADDSGDADLQCRDITIGTGRFLTLRSGTYITSPNTDQVQVGAGAMLMMLGGTTSSFPALKRSTTSLQGRLADDSAFCPVQAKLTTDTNATTGLTAGVLSATTNASIVVYDASGQAYRIPCII